MKKTLTTLTLAAIMMFGATFTFAGDGIIVAGRPAADCQPATNGIIVAGKTIVNVLFGIIVAGSPIEQCVETDGIIVAG